MTYFTDKTISKYHIIIYILTELTYGFARVEYLNKIYNEIVVNKGSNFKINYNKDLQYYTVKYKRRIYIVQGFVIIDFINTGKYKDIVDLCNINVYAEICRYKECYKKRKERIETLGKAALITVCITLSILFTYISFFI